MTFLTMKVIKSPTPPPAHKHTNHKFPVHSFAICIQWFNFQELITCLWFKFTAYYSIIWSLFLLLKSHLLNKHTDAYFNGKGYKERTESILDHIVNRINEYINIFKTDISEFKYNCAKGDR